MKKSLLSLFSFLCYFISVAQPSTVAITVSGATGNGGAFIAGNTVTAQWDNGIDGATGVTVVTFDFTQFGGGAAVLASDIGGDVYQATYVMPASGVTESTTADVSVSVTATAGGGTTEDNEDNTVDDVLPSATAIATSIIGTISDSDIPGTVTFTVSFDETMNTGVDPTVDFPTENPGAALAFNAGSSMWNGNDYEAVFDITDTGLDLADIDVRVTGGEDANGNALSAAYTESDLFSIDTENPNLTAAAATPSTGTLAITDALTALITEGSAEATLSVNAATINGVDVSTFFTNNANGTYSFTYTVSASETDRAAGAIPLSIVLEDVNGNVSNTLIAWTDGNTTAVDANRPSATGIATSIGTISESDIPGTVTFTVSFDETMNTGVDPTVDFPTENPGAALVFNAGSSMWNGNDYEAVFDIADTDLNLANIDVRVIGGEDAAGNTLSADYTESNLFNIDTENPSATAIATSIVGTISESDIPGTVIFTVSFDETMNTGVDPTVDFPAENPGAALVFNAGSSMWNGNDYEAVFDIADTDLDLANIDVRVTGGEDANGNALSAAYTESDLFSIDTENPNLTAAAATPSTGTLAITDALTALITEGSAEATLSVNAATINGVDVSTFFTNNANGTYSFTYTVSASETDRAAGAIPLSIVLEDVNGNVSNTLIAWTDGNTTAVDANRPSATGIATSIGTISESDIPGTVTFTVSFDETMNTGVDPTVDFPVENPGAALVFNAGSSMWNGNDYEAVYDIADTDLNLADIDVRVSGGEDAAGNTLSADYTESNLFNIDTENPSATAIATSIVGTISDSDIPGTVTFTVSFDETMNTGVDPTVDFPVENPGAALAFNAGLSMWNGNDYEAVFDITDTGLELANIDVRVSGGEDAVGNAITGDYTEPDLFNIDTQNPSFVDATFYDTDSDGSVDEILLEFSEDIDELSVSDADFNIGIAGFGGTTFFVDTGFPVGNGVDANTTDNFITLAVDLGTTDDQTIAYNQGSLADEAGNLAATLGSVTTIDVAPPVLTDVQIEDTNDDGFIDRVVYTFSEIVTDVDNDDIAEATEFGTITLPDAELVESTDRVDGDVILSNDGTYGYLTISNIGEQITENTSIGSLGVTGVNGVWEDAEGLTSIGDASANNVDAASPVIIGTIISTNSVATLTFSEGIYGNVGATLPVTTANFTFDIDGGVVGENVVSVKTTAATESDDAVNVLVGGESTIKVFFAFTPPNTGGETITMDTDGNIFDDATNTAAATQFPPSNQGTLDPPDVPNLSEVIWLDQNSDGMIDAVSFTFDIDWDIDEPGGGDNSDGLDCFVVTNGATPITQDNFDYDEAGTNGSGFYDAGTFETLTFAGDPQPGTSVANLQITYVTANDRIESQSTEDDALNGDTPEIHSDGAAPRFVNFSATILDDDADGNVDRIQIDAQDNIDDGAINPAEFTYNGVPATGVANSDNTDESFTLLFDGNGTAVEGDFVYTPGTSLLDTAANASNGGTINAASITDGAGPVILDALTLDTEATPDGLIDEILVTFSENLSTIFGDQTFFSVDAGGDSYTVNTATPGPGADEVTLAITEGAFTGNGSWPAPVLGKDTYITPDVTITAGYGDDAAGALTPAQTFTNTSDGAAPYSEVDVLATNDTSPEITGSVDDPNATILVNIGTSTVPATNNGDGTWTLPDNSIVGIPLGAGQEVTAICVDSNGNTETDVTSAELTINGGADITPASLTGICVSDGFQALGDIRILETGNGDFGSTGTILLTLPSGFEFNPAVPAVSDGSSTLIDITVAYAFIGTATLEITVTYDGSDDGIDDVIIENLQVQAVTGGAGGNLERAGGTAALSTTDTNYATLASNAEPPGIASLDETVAGDNDITSLTITLGTTFSLDATDQGPTTLNWYENVFDGTPEFVGPIATQADLNVTEGLHTYFLSNNDGTCDSDPITFNLLVYDYSDNGTDNFLQRTFRSTDDPDTMVFSNPANHTVSVSGSGIVANISEVGTLKAVFDPSTVAEGTYVITYSVENQLGETQTVVGSFTVEALSDLIQEFRRNGVPDAAPGEDYCETDILSFDADLTEVSLLASAYFFRFSYLKTAGPGFYTTFPIAFPAVGGASYPADPNQNNGAGTPAPFPLGGHNPNTNWDLDLSTLDPGASYDIYLEYNRIGDGARGQRRVFSLNVEALPTVSIVNFGGLCENEDGNIQLEATVNGSTGFMTNGFELEFFNGITWIPEASYPDENLNPFDLQISEGGSGPGQYRVIYTSTPQGDANCTNSDTLAFTLFPTPNEPFLNVNHNISWRGAPWIDTTDPENGFDSYVMEFCSVSDLSFFVGENSGILYNWYASDGMTLLQGNQWFISTAVAFDDPSTGGVTETPTAGTETVFYFATTQNGCESALKKITVYIYEDTDLPEPDPTYLTNNGTMIDANRYVFEYCDTYVPIELTGPSAAASNPTSRNPSARYFLYSSDFIRRDTINTSNITAAQISLPAGTQDTTIYISHLWNDQTPDGVGTTLLPFEGCESGLVQFDIKVTTTPTDVTTADFDAGVIQFHVAEGNTLGDIAHTLGLVEKYRWYNDPTPTGQVGPDILTGQEMLETTLNGDGFDPSVVSVQYVNDVYDYYVTRLSGENAETGFVGCESTGPTNVQITVHSIQRQPDVASDNTNSGISTTPFTDLGVSPNGADHYFSICVDQLESDIQLRATEPLYGGASREFRWYSVDASLVRISQTPLAITDAPTFTQLQIAGLSPSVTISRHFEVVQITDTDVFEGTESESGFVQIDISPQDALELRDDATDLVFGDVFCRDETSPSFIDVDLFAGGASAGAGNVDYDIDSYLQSTFIATPGSPEIDGPVTPGNPTLDFDALHDAVTGSQAVGGEPTVHVITMTYNDPVTLCAGSVTKTITIHPDPDITFFVEVGGVLTDIAAFAAGDNEFCYEDGSITLQGALADGTTLNSGTFVSSQLGALTTVNGSAAFNTINEHNSFHGVGGTDGEFLNQSSITITYNYTDPVTGCDNTTNTILLVNPQPEVLAVPALPPADLADGNPNIIRITDFCEGSTAVTAEIKIIDPVDLPTPGDEEGDYSSYTFDWTVGGSTVTDLNLDGLDNTIEFVPPSNTLNITVVVTDLNGCSESFSETHTLQSLPDLDITGVEDFLVAGATALSSYCVNDGDPALGLTDATLNGQSLPNTVALGDIVSYSVDSYNEADGVASAVTIDAGTGALPTVDLDAWHTDGTLVTPGTLVGGNATYHRITVVYQDPSRAYQGVATTCTNAVVETIVVNPDPDISITLNGVDADNLQFCYDDINIEITGIDVASGLPNNDGTITINGGTVSTNGSAIINADTYHGGDPFAAQTSHTIVYTYTDGKGCDNSITRTFFVNPRPEFVGGAIQTASTCATSSVELFVDMTDGVSNYTFTWFVNGAQVDGVDVIDEDGIDNDERITFNFGGQLSANFGVIATYTGAGFTTNCEASIQNQSITVGAEPIPAISWVGITAGNANGTDFTITEDNATLPDGDVDFVELEIDGTVVLSTTSPTFPLDFNYDPSTPGYSFGSSGEYVVNLTMNTTAGCNVTVSRNIRILPHLTTISPAASYSESFENASSFDLTQGGWLIDSLSIDGKTYYDTATSWTRGNMIPGTAASIDGTGAVYTVNAGVNGYKESEVSFVYSPSFDLSSFSAPTVSFLRYEDFETDRDGVVFQVSVDDGRTWQTVGTFNDELEDEGLASTPGWYNKDGISSSPGVVAPGSATATNSEQVGWAENSDWQEAISPIEIDPAQSGFVRFRFAMSAQATVKTTNGFGFDLVRIYERNQIVLLELFSSTLTAKSVIVNDTVNTRPQYSGADILKINYFTDLANGIQNPAFPETVDQINQKNMTDPGAKVAFYGVGEVPSLSIAGDINVVDPLTDPYSLLNAKLANARLNNPAFDITLNTSVDGEGNLVVDADFTATADLGPDAEFALFIAVVEPTVTLPTRMGLYPAGAEIENVFRKLLPTAAGQWETGPITAGDTRSIQTLSWPINNMFDPSNIRVIAFVQDLQSQQVYQATFEDVATGLSNNVLGLDDLPTFKLYPNPADEEVTLEFADGIEEDSEWVIFDQAGREVMKGFIERGTTTMTVQTSDVPSGLYFIHLYGEDRKTQTKRVMVIH